MRLTRGRYVLQRQPADLGAFGGRAAKAGLSYEAFVPASIADMEVRLSGVAAADVADAEAALMRLAHSSVAVPSLEALARRGGGYRFALAPGRFAMGRCSSGGRIGPTPSTWAPHEEVAALLADLAAFVPTRRDLSPMVVAAIAHAQYESVLPPMPIAFARPQARYVEGLNAFRSDDLDGWLTVFATAVSFAFDATIGLANVLGQLQRSWLGQLTEARAESGRRPPRARP